MLHRLPLPSRALHIIHLVVALAFICLWSTSSFAVSPIEIDGNEDGLRLGQNYELWHDTQGNASIDQVQTLQRAGEFIEGPNNGSTGLQTGAFWSHFFLKNVTDQTVTVHLEYVDHQLIYLNAYKKGIGEPGFSEIADMSLFKPFSERPIPHHRFVVPVTIEAGETAELYFRYGSEDSGYVFPSLRISSPKNLRQTQSIEVWLVALFVGSLLLMAIMALVGKIRMGDKYFSAYFVYALAKLCVWPTVFGFTHQFIFTTNFHWSYMSAASAMALFAGINFARVFLNTRKNTPKLDYVLLAMLLNAALLAVAALLREEALAHIFITIAFLMTPFMVIVGIMRARQGSTGGAIFACAWTLLTWGLFNQAMRDIGLLDHTFFNYYLPPMASYCEMVVMLAAIDMRIRWLKNKKDEAEKRYTEQLENTREELEILVAERTRELEIAKSHAEYEASTDALTGVSNRRSFLQQANDEMIRCQKNGEGLHLLMFDIDHFKRINDTHGHAVGDIALKQFAEIIRHHLRDEDIFGRIGGEEFALLLSGSKQTVMQTAQRLCDTIRDADVETSHGHLNISTSIGVAKLESETALEQLLARADEALYKAKQLGRDRVIYS